MKVVYVSYPASDEQSAGGGVPASAENALGLREHLEGRGHQLVTTSDTGVMRRRRRRAERQEDRRD
jgi:formate dehydrogenase